MSPDMLIHALALGREYGAQPNVSRLNSVSVSDLRQLAMRLLKQENIGVERNGPRFVVREECLKAFVEGMRASAPHVSVVEAERAEAIAPRPRAQRVDAARREIEQLRAARANMLRAAEIEDEQMDTALARRLASASRRKQRINLGL